MARSAATTATKVAKPEAASPSDDDKQHDFFWTYTEEPHRTRRLAIIKAHPEARHSPKLLRNKLLTLRFCNRSSSYAVLSL